MLNVTTMTGRLTHDPELRKTASGVPVASFSIAVKRDYAKKDDDTTDFFDVVAWRATAEFVCKYFKKGSLIQVLGRFENRKWADKHEQARVSMELIADRVYFGDSKAKDSGDNDINPFPDEAANSAPVADNDPQSPPPGFDPFG